MNGKILANVTARVYELRDERLSRGICHHLYIVQIYDSSYALVRNLKQFGRPRRLEIAVSSLIINIKFSI
jgi:hypothetical protein